MVSAGTGTQNSARFDTLSRLSSSMLNASAACLGTTPDDSPALSEARKRLAEASSDLANFFAETRHISAGNVPMKVFQFSTVKLSLPNRVRPAPVRFGTSRNSGAFGGFRKVPQRFWSRSPVGFWKVPEGSRSIHVGLWFLQKSGRVPLRASEKVVKLSSSHHAVGDGT